jgi:hypothetical protein
MDDIDFEKLSPAEKKAWLAMVRVLGTAEIEFVGSLTAPIYWAVRDGHGRESISGGSIFFLNTGANLFAVTAAHVITACLEAHGDAGFVQCMIGRHGMVAFPFDLPNRIIDLHKEMDIATLRFNSAEVDMIGRTVLTGFQLTWPPRLATQGRFVTYAGLPGVGRYELGPREISFGLVTMGGCITSSHEGCISIQIVREELAQVHGEQPMPENFNFGGMSGGPVLEIVQRGAFRGWMLAGVIFQGPNPTGDAGESIAGFEVIRARPAHFILADGTLDRDRWEQSRPLRIPEVN